MKLNKAIIYLKVENFSNRVKDITQLRSHNYLTLIYNSLCGALSPNLSAHYVFSLKLIYDLLALKFGQKAFYLLSNDQYIYHDHNLGSAASNKHLGHTADRIGTSSGWDIIAAAAAAVAVAVAAAVHVD